MPIKVKNMLVHSKMPADKETVNCINTHPATVVNYVPSLNSFSIKWEIIVYGIYLYSSLFLPC